jgi:hypothetical protein
MKIATGFMGLGAMVLAGLPAAEAQQRHWFFDSYNQYDGNVFVPYNNRRPLWRYHRYPWWRPGLPQDSVVEYEVAPGQWVTVYPDGRTVYPRGMRKPQEEFEQPESLRHAQRPPVRTNVPLPKTKPPASQSAKIESADSENSLAAIELPPDSTSRAVDSMPTGSLKSVNCEEAQKIVTDFGFSDVRATSCSGKTYALEAIRDGQPYSIKLSAADGELTEVKKR